MNWNFLFWKIMCHLTVTRAFFSPIIYTRQQIPRHGRARASSPSQLEQRSRFWKKKRNLQFWCLQNWNFLCLASNFLNFPISSPSPISIFSGTKKFCHKFQLLRRPLPRNFSWVIFKLFSSIFVDRFPNRSTTLKVLNCLPSNHKGVIILIASTNSLEDWLIIFSWINFSCMPI